MVLITATPHESDPECIKKALMLKLKGVNLENWVTGLSNLKLKECTKVLDGQHKTGNLPALRGPAITMGSKTLGAVLQASLQKVPKQF